MARVLRSEIFAGKLRAGEALPERALAARLRVSRTPVREALFILQSEGLVELVPNRGASVRRITADDLTEIYSIRGLLEGHAAELAAERCSEEQLDAMEDAQIRLRRMVSRGSAADQAAADLAFHTALSEATGSPLLTSLLSQVLAFTVSFRANYRYPEARSQTALAEHQDIFEAIRSRDAALAGRLMRAHVESSCRFALEQFHAGDQEETATDAALL
ncbi:DNA-binding GntR family transcriptional regulator [Thermocatellispora tengchongensis]|uniref:DNA-binding GntR family transcriptional regulator n=1 Tax=Thermocatellispora tengchongensis TaxID=1073253 RepID=A0A840PJZ4_9ACTN|nr:GntR family transcriptional regulator [Thermocatellispora tengchongensis]MBB5137910.1 DNA-binding GntR family transcriptional regulator [Thermocatellispora tengchongensis]